MEMNTIEWTIMVNEAIRKLRNDKRPIEIIIEQCMHADGNAIELTNQVMETECRLYLVGLSMLFQHDLYDISEPYDYLASFSLTTGDIQDGKEKMQK